MIQYTMTVSEGIDSNRQSVPYYGLKAVNEKGEEVLSLPSISSNPNAVEYLVNHFNQVRIDRSTFG
ncbi:MAG: hypothetical protein IJ079_11180 [Lachnospiraceae bacterium]|nr:hypothetical protein [Lachnospiraceae bacterium]